MRPVFLVLCAIAVLASTPAARAQSVAIQRQDGAGGYGFVFGSPRTGACWMATPAHVLRTSKADPLTDVTISDAQGRAGYTQDAIVPDETVDLAFARVTGLDGNCYSRLPSGSIDYALEPGRGALLTLINNRSQSSLPLRITESSAAGARQSFAVEPVASAARQAPRLLKGFSGALVTRQNAGALGDNDLPIGLLTDVCSEGDAPAGAAADLFGDGGAPAPSLCSGRGHYGIVLRMDTIRQLFDRAESGGPDGSSRSAASTTYMLSSFTGRTIAQTPAAMMQDGTCWQVTPPEGTRVVSLSLLLPDQPTLQRIDIDLCSDLTGVRGVEVRGASDTDAQSVSYNYCTIDTPALSCRIGQRRPARLDLNFHVDDADTVLGIGMLEME